MIMERAAEKIRVEGRKSRGRRRTPGKHTGSEGWAGTGGESYAWSKLHRRHRTARWAMVGRGLFTIMITSQIIVTENN